MVTKLPRTSHLHIPLIGTFLTAAGRGIIQRERPGLLSAGSYYRWRELIKGRLWLVDLVGPRRGEGGWEK